MGWSVAKIAETWSTRAHPLTAGEVQDTLDKLSLEPYPALSAQAQLHRRVNPEPVTYGEFQHLVHEHGWSEDWLTQQLSPHVDDPRRIAQELLAGEGRQRPFTGDYDPQAVCDRRETAISYACVLEL